MGRRSIIGILYQPDNNWIGGTYYIQNLVQALNTCADADLPVIKVYCNSHEDFLEFYRITNYPYLKERLIHRFPLLYRFWRIFNRYFLRTELPAPHLFARKGEKDIFVYPTHPSSLVDKTKTLGWIPDFQDKHLPHFFSNQELDTRTKVHKTFIEQRIPVILSSKTAQQDYLNFYPDSKNIKTFVLPFAVTHPVYSAEDIDYIREKYGINCGYLFCANQFWKHKNHLFLFKSFCEAKKKGLKLKLVCSGKFYDNRNPEYIDEVKQYIQDNNLQDDIIMLGFISRTEQLCLMKNAYAIIQPSLFEGWSTVVEDAKCMNQFIFLSDIPVHREQHPLNVCYFNPYDEDDLIQKLLTTTITTNDYDYSRDLRKFGETFINIINEIQYDKTIDNNN